MTDLDENVIIPSAEEVAQYGGTPTEPAGETAPVDPVTAQPEATGAPADTPTPETDWKELALRARAELSNYQKRAEKDRIEFARYANAGLLKALLPILDNLERVIQTGEKTDGNAKALLDGVQLILDQFQKTLRDYHVETIAAEDQPFDPQIHEAMMERPSDHAERVVLQELAKGYKLYDRVLRPAKVIVSKPAATTETTASEG